MEIRAFIQSNYKQLVGANIAKFCLEKELKVKTEILNIDELPDLGLKNLRYKRGGIWVDYDCQDLQSFTLVRFLPPTLMNFNGFALVIDPDIFALKELSEILSICRSGNFSIAARRKKSAYDSSVMIMNCKNLQDKYSWASIVERLKSGEVDYADLMSLNLSDLNVMELEPKFNSWDFFDSTTLFLHTTNRLTQPWKTGLKIDFTRNDPGRYLGVIPKKLILKLLGKWPSRYQEHPSKHVEKKFFDLAQLAISSGSITLNDLDMAIRSKSIRPDFKRFIRI
jgi:hypothetical protein